MDIRVVETDKSKYIHDTFKIKYIKLLEFVSQSTSVMDYTPKYTDDQ